MTNIELKQDGRLTIEEYAMKHHVDIDVIESLVRIYDGIPAKKSDTGEWYIREKLPFRYSKEECEEIHIGNTISEIFKENNARIKNPRIYGAPKAVEEYTLLKSNGYSIYFDDTLRKFEVQSDKLGKGFNISDMLKKRNKKINQKTILAIAQGQIKRKIYNSFMVISNNNGQYMLGKTLDEAKCKAKNLAEKKTDIYPIRIYSHGIKIEEYSNKDEVFANEKSAATLAHKLKNLLCNN